MDDITEWCRPDFNFEFAWQLHEHNAWKEVKDSNEGSFGLHAIQAEATKVLNMALPHFLFECYCEHIRHTRSRPYAPLEDRKAAELIATEKYCWTPDQVKSMEEKDLIFALHAEIFEIQYPRHVYDAIFNTQSRYFDYRHAEDVIAHLKPPSVECD